MNTTNVDMTKPTKRFGLIPARIGTSILHTLGISMPLAEPEYSVASKAVGSRTRIRANTNKPHYAYSSHLGVSFPTAALPGAPMYLDVQDLSRLEPELVEHVKWTCTHRDCLGKMHASRELLTQSHGKNKDLIDEANRDPRGGQAHLFHAVIEIPAVAEQKDEKTGKVTRHAQPATVIVASDEE